MFAFPYVISACRYFYVKTKRVLFEKVELSGGFFTECLKLLTSRQCMRR